MAGNGPSKWRWPAGAPAGILDFLRTARRAAEDAMTYEHILLEEEDGVAILTLNRPDKLNAMNRLLSRELHDAVKRAEADNTIGCIVVTGAGEKAFSAGGDIPEPREA